MGRGLFALFVRPRAFVLPAGAPVPIEVQALDHTGKPVSAAVTVELDQEAWNPLERRYTRSTRPLASATVTTDRSGRAQLSLAPEPGARRADRDPRARRGRQAQPHHRRGLGVGVGRARDRVRVPLSGARGLRGPRPLQARRHAARAHQHRCEERPGAGVPRGQRPLRHTRALPHRRHRRRQLRAQARIRAQRVRERPRAQGPRDPHPHARGADRRRAPRPRDHAHARPRPLLPARLGARPRSRHATAAGARCPPRSRSRSSTRRCSRSSPTTHPTRTTCSTAAAPTRSRPRSRSP